MNRRRVNTTNTNNQKSFVSGGVYDPTTQIKKQQSTPRPSTPQRTGQGQVQAQAQTPVNAVPQQQQQTQQYQQQQQYEQQQKQPQQQQQPQQPPQQVKEEVVVPALEPPPENPFRESSLTLDTSDIVDANGKVKFKKIFMTRKKASVRVKEKRTRQNRRLRKTIIPKNALMALNELKGVSISEFTINSNLGGGFTALVTVNNNQYEGLGGSKVAAKNNACEKAMRDYIIAKMRENPRNMKSINSNNTTGSEAMDTSDGNTNNETEDAEDDVPMVNLASFAIYKLFSEWENDGYVIPEMHPAIGGNTSDNDGSVIAKEPKKVPIRNELPHNWEAMHPASLLCMMRPGVTYVEKGCVGEKPNVLQSLGVTVDDQDFVASGRSKKLARRNVAALACNTLFNSHFELDMKTDAGAGN